MEGGRACILSVRAQPGARRAGFSGTWNGMLKIAVTAPPEQGRANHDLVEVIAHTLGLRRSQVTLVSGELSRTKKFRLEIPADVLRQRLDRLDASGAP